ncbi:MAG: hypothetical protein MJ158_04455, partial [Alphaproteobacteria bacterium]|nr:hypothetical protein [Alphaproteobacteria bacterium]
IAASRKILKESNAILVSYGFKPCPEIEELVKNDNIFVKHTKKAKEIVFKKATQKLQDDILRTQNVVHQTGSDERL